MLKRISRSIEVLVLGLLAPAIVAAILLPPIEIEPTVSLAAWQARPYDPALADAYWHETYAAFAREDLDHPVAPGGIVFVGSSSIRLWSKPAHPQSQGNVVIRGFGGSMLADCARHVDVLVTPSRPQVVVVYAGENDLAQGASPGEVLSSYIQFVESVHAAAPALRIVFVSIKPSPSRSHLLEKMRMANRLIEEHARSDPSLHFVDIYAQMVDENGKPRLDLFMADQLHLSEAGYAVWNSALVPHLQ